MESWQREIEYIEHLFFKGYLFGKYRGDINNYLTERDDQGRNYINLSSFYDLEIDDVKRIEESDYNRSNTVLGVKDLSKELLINYEDKDFRITPSEIFLVKKIDPEHEQVEDGEVHGTLMDQEVIFMMLKKRTKVICVEGAIVSSEELPDGSTKEVYISNAESCQKSERIIPVTCVQGKPTGNTKQENGYQWIEVYNSDCSTKWIIKSKICNQDEPTGNQRISDGWLLMEFTNADCSTYWKKVEKVCVPGSPTGQTRITNGKDEYEVYNNDCSTKWIQDTTTHCIQGAWTGEERKKRGWVQREYTYQDCSTYWKNYKKIEPKGSCLENLLWIILALLVLGLIIGLIVSKTILAFLLGLLFLGLGHLLIYGLFFLVAWLSSYLVRFFKVFLSIASVALFGLILYFISTGLDDWSNRRQSTLENRRSSDKSEAVIIPEKTESKEESNSFDPQPKFQDSVNIYMKWKSFDNKLYEGTFSLSTNDIRNSKRNVNTVSRSTLSDIGYVYDRSYQNDKNKLISVYQMLDSIKRERKLSKLDFANLVVSMIQNLEYALVFEQDCRDLRNSRNREIRELFRNDVECHSPHSFGFKTPLEFLSSIKGDCDTRTLTIYTILKHYNYDVTIMNSDIYKHSMIGLNIGNSGGAYKNHRGKRYYFWETTSKNIPLGYLPPEMSRVINWYIVLN